MNQRLKKKKYFSKIFPTPEFLLFSTSGVAITDDGIKFAQIKRNLLGTGLSLAHSSRIATPPGTMESGEIKDPIELASALRELSSRYGLEYVRAILPDEKAYLFNTTIDRVPQDSLQDAVAFAVEENVPLSLQDAVFSFDAFESSMSPNRIDLTVSVLPKDVVKTHIDLFESVGITPVSFDLESQAVSRAVVRRGDWNSYLVVNVFEGKTGLYIVDDGVVKFSLVLQHGFGDLLGASSLRDEINKVMGFWNFHSGPLSNVEPDEHERSIEKIILCGPGATDEKFVGEILSGVDVAHEIANVWVNVSNKPKVFSVMSLEESLEYADAVGLALPRKEYIYV